MSINLFAFLKIVEIFIDKDFFFHRQIFVSFDMSSFVDRRARNESHRAIVDCCGLRRSHFSRNVKLNYLLRISFDCRLKIAQRPLS